MSCNDDTKAKVEMINSDIESKGEKERKKERRDSVTKLGDF